MKVSFPKDSYLKGMEVNEDTIDLTFSKKKRIALLFISLNEGYWPYLAQVLKDCRKNFMPHHKVDFFVWTDYTPERAQKQLDQFDEFAQGWTMGDMRLVQLFVQTCRLYNVFYPDLLQEQFKILGQKGIFFRQEGTNFLIEATSPPTMELINSLSEAGKTVLQHFHQDMAECLKGVTITETGSIGWPAPTLMRYHLFLNQKEPLTTYDYLYYMDADMRVVEKVSDEILGTIVTAPHPGYAIAAKFIPPYEPNPSSSAYIHRLGQLVDENGKKRFMPFYAAGGFQGGKSKNFILAMEKMKENIDYDFDRLNYTAIWNDESHWNKYLWNYKGKITFLDVSYVYPDSMIEQYYIPLWGKEFKPKIITLTKPFSLSAQGGAELQSLAQMPK